MDPHDETRQLRRQLASTEAELSRLRHELIAIQRSRLWRAGHLYWNLRRRFAGLLGGRETSAAPGRSLPLDLILSEPARRLADRFRHFRLRGEDRFFAALTEYFRENLDAPYLDLHFEYAAATNQRGRALAAHLAATTPVAGKRVLDVGAAYGGFMVAFAERGATVTGIDINPGFLGLGRVNLEEQGIPPERLFEHDATVDRADFHGAFDLILANDVVEHVQDLDGFLGNLARWLRPGGTIWCEIPNGAHTPFVIEDGHYRLFGIVLLDFAEARRYHLQATGHHNYDTFNYLDVAGYRARFAAAGLSFEVLPETLDGLRLQQLEAQADELRRAAPAGLAKVPAELRPEVERRLQAYLAEFAAAPRGTAEERQRFLLHYGPAFWRVAARPLTSIAEGEP